MKKRWCQLCGGYGFRSVVMDITEKCKQCNGEGRIDWPDEWRPYEQNAGNAIVAENNRYLEGLDVQGDLSFLRGKRK